MISFNNLGNQGHLGNQMFQYAATKGIAAKRNQDFMIPPRQSFGSRYPAKSFLDDCFDLNCKRGISNFTTINETNFCYDESIIGHPNEDIDILGYFQTEKYFIDIEDQIKFDFKFKNEILEYCQKFFIEQDINDGCISLHIRRGDYVTNPNHPVQTEEYYKQSLDLMPSELPVIVFSDDSNWCMENKLFDDDRFMVSQDNLPGIDMCLMTLCDHHIIANSSFSWWGSWLSQSKKTIAPKNWFGGECINHDTKDLYPSKWILI